MYFITIRQATRSKARCQMVGFLLRPLLQTITFLMCHHVSAVVLISSSYNCISCIEFKPTHITSFNKGKVMNLKALYPKSHPLRYKESGSHHMNLSRDRFQPITVRMTLHFNLPGRSPFTPLVLV